MLRFGLVGCGRIAQRHAGLLGSGTIAGAKLQAVCDLSQEKANNLGHKYSVSAYTDFTQMMRSEPIDVAVVLTESGYHAEHVIELAKFKKHIVVEKPMALSSSDAMDMIKECDFFGIKLFVVKQNRFNVPVVKLREAVEKDDFGKLVLGTVRVRWCRDQEYYNQASWRGTKSLDGGVLSNQAIHHIDLLQWMMGRVSEVHGYAITSLVDIEAEDTAVVNLKFANGALGIIEATTATRPSDLEGSLSILGEKGTVEIGGFAVNKLKVWNFKDQLNSDDILEKYSVNPPDVYGFGHHAYYDHVVASINGSGSFLIDGMTGLESLKIVEAIYKSIDQNKAVEIF